MKQAALNDPPVAEWEAPWRRRVDAVILLAADDACTLAEPHRLIGPLADVAEIVGVERGAELHGGIEHFGFRDNISQPVFYAEDIDAARRVGAVHWDPAAPLRLVLVADGDGYGSYAVLRKLEQDVAVFRENVARLAATLEIDRRLAEAFVIGRFHDGTPVTVSDGPGLGPIDDFDFFGDGAGRRCPFASHIRNVNPRGELDALVDFRDRDRRIARRSIPYGAPGDRAVGMLFQCFQADIAAQFEVLQVNWCNFGDFPRRSTGADPIAGRRNSWEMSQTAMWPRGWGSTERVGVDLAECVTMRGGEYLFAPSPGFLRGLA